MNTADVSIFITYSRLSSLDWMPVADVTKFIVRDDEAMISLRAIS